jgi:hypothetical protein
MIGRGSYTSDNGHESGRLARPRWAIKPTSLVLRAQKKEAANRIDNLIAV